MHSLVKTVMIPLVVLLICIAAPQGAQARLCVQYALALSDIEVRGNAWAWWDNAAGRYERGQRPAVGSVLVFRRAPHLRLGHVSVVSGVVDRRTILVDHSWIGDRLFRGMRVVDTSPNNDWSSVRVWHPHLDALGQTNYATYGFIYSPGRGGGGARPEIAVAAAPHSRPEPHRTPAARPAQVAAFDPRDVPLPGRRPGVAEILTASAVPAAAPLPARRPRTETVLAAAAETLVSRPATPAATAVAMPEPAGEAVRVAAAGTAPAQAAPQGLNEVPRPGRRPVAAAVAPVPQTLVAGLHGFVLERRKPVMPGDPPQLASRFGPDAF